MPDIRCKTCGGRWIVPGDWPPENCPWCKATELKAEVERLKEACVSAAVDLQSVMDDNDWRMRDSVRGDIDSISRSNLIR